VYRVDGAIKRDPIRRWNLPDRVFFACGACHVLAYAFLERYGGSGGRAMWMRPDPGFTGNHVLVVGPGPDPGWAFDYHGYTRPEALLAHARRKAARWWPGWGMSLAPLAVETLVSEPLSRRHEGLWLREPGDFLHNALPRAHAYLGRFPAPPLPS